MSRSEEMMAGVELAAARTVEAKGDLAPKPRAGRVGPRLQATLMLLGGFWGFWWVALTFYWWLAGEGDLIPDAIRRGPVMLIGAGLSLCLSGALHLLRRRSFLLRGVATGLLLLPIGFLYAAASITIFQGWDALLFVDPDAAGGVLRDLALKVIRWAPSLICCSAMVLALEYAFDVKAREQRIRELSSVAQRAHLAALRFQVNPHFLFNSLNSAISLIVTQRPAEAEQLLRNLAAFLRSTLAHAPLDEISLAEELALQEVYLHVEKVRFPDRLRFVSDITPEAAQARVPSLLLQPLVENALKYGVGRSLGVTTVSIRAAVENGSLKVTVANDRADSSARAEGLGLGLANVRQRLQAAYGAAAAIEAGEAPEGGYEVRLTVPFNSSAPPDEAQSSAASSRPALRRGTPSVLATSDR